MGIGSSGVVNCANTYLGTANYTVANGYVADRTVIVDGNGPAQLNLNFTRDEVLDPRITFSRTSNATRVNAQGLIETVAINQPRFDYDPVTLAPKGLLIEESRTNLIRASENLSAVTWTKPGTPVLDSLIQDPSGNINTVYYPTVSEIYQIFDGAGAGTISLSFFGKKRESSSNNQIVIQIFQQVSGSVIDLGSYGFSLVTTNPDSTYFKNIKREQYQNEWYRFSCQIVANTGAGTGNFSASSRIDIEGGSAQNYVWGIQIELNAFPTSYIPTTSAQVTRTADNASMTGTNFSSWYNQSEGTVVVDVNTQLSVGYIIGIMRAVGFGPRIQCSVAGVTNTTGAYIVDDSGSVVVSLSRGGLKSAFAYKSDDYALSANGLSAVTDNSGIVPSGITQLKFCRSPVDDGYLNGHIKSFKYFNKRLSPNTYLQSLTQ